MPVLQAAGARPLHLADAGGRRGVDLAGAARLHAGRHRLARAAAHLAASDCRLTGRSACGGRRPRSVAPATRPQIYVRWLIEVRAKQLSSRAWCSILAELPDDVATLKALLIAADKRARDLDAEIETLKLTIAKLQHERFGPSSERARLLDQLELQLGELVEHAAQAATAAEIAAAQPSQPDGGQAARKHAAAPQAGTPPASRQSAARAPRRALARGVPVLRRPACASSARTSPRRWSACRRSGR